MFWSKKTQQNNTPSITCPCCGVEFRATGGKTVTMKNDYPVWEGPSAGKLTQTYPRPVPQPKSATRTRIEQSVAVGVALVVCATTLFSLVGWSLSWLATVKWAVIIGSGTFVVSVALGSDNWGVIFRWLDRNGDGSITWDDLEELKRDILGDDSEQDTPRVPPVEVERGLMVYNGKKGRQLCPMLPFTQVLEMARKSAAMHLSAQLPEDKRYNFTKQFVGKPWGDYLTHAQNTLIILGMAEKRGNNTTLLNEAGSAWLAEINKNA